MLAEILCNDRRLHHNGTAAESLPDCEAHLCLDIVDQATPSSILHNEVEDVVCEVHVQQADDAWMLQARQHADLILDLINLRNAAEVAGVHRLDGYCLSCRTTLC